MFTKEPMGRMEALLNRVVSGPYPWWLWPSVLVTMAGGALGAALLFYPSPTDPTMVFVAGVPFGGECGMKQALGLPCPQCGMTRSWVYLARGRVIEAFTFNTAGALLLLWIWVGGLFGAIRLVTGDPDKLRLPWVVLFIWALFWMAVPYVGFWVARMVGWNVLPEYL